MSRAKQKTAAKPVSLIPFLAAMGGVRDDGGELRALDLHRRLVPGIGAFVRPRGLPLDKARELAQEHGYIGLPDQDMTGDGSTTIRDLLDAVWAEARGARCYPGSYQAPLPEPDPDREEHDRGRAEAARTAEDAAMAALWRRLIDTAAERGSAAAWEFIVHHTGIGGDDPDLPF